MAPMVGWDRPSRLFLLEFGVVEYEDGNGGRKGWGVDECG